MTASMMELAPAARTIFSGVTVMLLMVCLWRTPQIRALRSSLPDMLLYFNCSPTIA